MKKEDSIGRCSARVFHQYRYESCKRRGVIEEDGKMWCRQHAPSTVRKREDRRRCWDNESKERDRKRRLSHWNHVIGKLEKHAPELVGQVKAVKKKLITLENKHEKEV